jgi:hypothetical protein
MSIIESEFFETPESQIIFCYKGPRFHKKDIDEWLTYENLKNSTGISIEVESVDINAFSYFVDCFLLFETVIPLDYFNFTVTTQFISQPDLDDLAEFILALPSLLHLKVEFTTMGCSSVVSFSHALENAKNLNFLDMTLLSFYPGTWSEVIKGISRSKSITHLFVNGSIIGQDKLFNELLLESKTLRSFGLDCQKIDFNQLTTGIASCKTLQKLLLRNTGVRLVPIQEIIVIFQAVSQNGNITALDLTQTDLSFTTDEGFLIAELIQNTPSLEILVLQNCKLTHEDEPVIRRIIQTSTLLHLNLRENYLNDADLLTIMIAVCKNSHLRELLVDDWDWDSCTLTFLMFDYSLENNASLFKLGIGDYVYGCPLSGPKILSPKEVVLLSYLERNRQNDKMKGMTLMVLCLPFLFSSKRSTYLTRDENAIVDITSDEDDQNTNSKRSRIN